MAEAWAPMEARNREIVMGNTWGHLAPKKNKTYRGRVVYAVGCFGSDDLNPTAIVSEWGRLDSSPWFYDALAEFLSDAPPELRKAGCVYEWTGTFRNYAFDGQCRELLNANGANIR